MEPSFFALQNYGAMQTLPAKVWNNADFAPQNNGSMQTLPPQNHRDIVSGDNIQQKLAKSKIILIKKKHIS